MPQLLEPNQLVLQNLISRSRQDADLTRRIDEKTFRQIRDLNLVRDSGRIVVIGRTPSYYVKQLATQAVQELFPGQVIENSIDVTR
ncbi:MAG: hypothetical protein JWM11_928 [Planctomycetaceae bacterium]|nr:hypothetical protein [Planctomycetaceae bacterium]